MADVERIKPKSRSSKRSNHEKTLRQKRQLKMQPGNETDAKLCAECPVQGKDLALEQAEEAPHVAWYQVLVDQDLNLPQ
jgi:hypothetical protein